MYRSLNTCTPRSSTMSRATRWPPRPPWTRSCAGSWKTGSDREAAKEVGKLIAERAKAKDITRVVFDRGGNLYHGRVAALAEGAREGGLEF